MAKDCSKKNGDIRSLCSLKSQTRIMFNMDKCHPCQGMERGNSWLPCTGRPQGFWSAMNLKVCCFVMFLVLGAYPWSTEAIRNEGEYVNFNKDFLRMHAGQGRNSLKNQLLWRHKDDFRLGGTHSDQRKSRWARSLDTSENDLLLEGQAVVQDFFKRYNTTREVDLVFVLDHSRSVPRRGWHAMLNFIRDLLEHFTVDSDNTRVAVITFSTTASVDINDLPPNSNSDKENKCTLHKRISDYLQNRVPYGYTATNAALRKAYDVLLYSRPTAKKAVFVLTDGRSNIGPPPVRAAVDLRALLWDQTWSTDTLGPQLEVYAIGIEQAELAELESIASNLPRHVLLIPDFHSFDQLARSLHGDKQEENWIPSVPANCGQPCKGTHAHCMCGTKVGQYACVCEPGFEMKDGTCTECPKGFYKEEVSPEPCLSCPANTTTDQTGSISLDQCELLPEFRVCPELPDIPNGSMFYVPGMRKDELNVLPTNRSCSSVSAGNSCHYTCDKGYRLNGPPYMLCNSSSQWVGRIPSCEVVDCETADKGSTLAGGSILYMNGSTTYGSVAVVDCYAGRHPTGPTLWTCTRYGLWMHSTNFQCLQVWCNPFVSRPFTSMVPAVCSEEKVPLGTVCNTTCDPGFVLDGPISQQCTFTNRAQWLPKPKPKCRDVEPPDIQCPPDLNVQVAHWHKNSTVIHLEHEAPEITDNSGIFTFRVLDLPPGSRFNVGHTLLTYEAKDGADNHATCSRKIHVKSREVALLFCPENITAEANSFERTRSVSWVEPVFVDFDNTSLPVTCTHPNPSSFRDITRVTCNPEGIATVSCKFYVIITDPACPIPFKDLQPMHGSLICGSALPLYPKSCRIHCKQGYELRLHRDDHKYTCSWDGTWDILKPWPACSRARRPPKATSDNEVVLNYDGPCEENKDDIAAAFKKSMAIILMDEHEKCRQEESSCAVTNVEVFCNSRSKRDVGSVSNPDWHSAPYQETEYPKYSHTRHLLQNDEISARNTYSNGTLRIEFEIMGTIVKPSENITKDNQIYLTYNLDDIFYKLEIEIENHWNFSVGNNSAEVTEIKSLKFPYFPVNCSIGEEMEIGEDDRYAVCVTCSEGMYWSSGRQTCQECPINTFQNQTGKEECVPCPAGAITLYNGSVSPDQCLGPCPVGHFSTTGYEPCTPCPRGRYQSIEGATDCFFCLPGYSTAEAGAAHMSNCTVFCGAGRWSYSGVEPCDPCPHHTYRPETASSSKCISCPPGMFTENSGSVSQDQCLEVSVCTLPNFDVCNGRGQCRSTSSSSNTTEGVTGNSFFGNSTNSNSTGWVVCECDQGYAGRYCEVDVDNCIGVVCQHGGKCVDLVDSYICSCAEGYIGVSCEIEVDECQSLPCLNGGSCEDRENGYICYCETGFHGSFCEVDEDECESQPCLHGNCTDGSGNYTCTCLAGYAGIHCEAEAEECESQPCLHGGLCEDTFNGYKCYCETGFAGDSCEIDINECASLPCIHGNCLDGIGEYICQCEPGYTGQNCEVVIEHCTDAPCVHGECRNDGDSYTCDCILGFTGVHCESVVDWCADHRCLNGATCVPLLASAVCKCRPPYTGVHCQKVAPADYDVVFINGDVNDYVLLRTVPRLTAFTVCAWLRSTDSLHYGTLLSYAVDNNWLGADPSNSITLYDMGRLQVHVNGQMTQTGVSLTSGHWHHLCVTWVSEGGRWQVFVNGTRTSHGHDLAQGTTVLAGGYLFIGQEQDLIGGGFNWRECFVGELTNFNMYDRVLDADTISDLSVNCSSDSDHLGDVVAWTDIAGALHGRVAVREKSWCPDLNECLYSDIFSCPDKLQCVDTLGNYTCESCAPGWTGPLCDIPVNECLSHPCMHGAVCWDGPEFGDYTCTCGTGYTGHRCEVKLDPCLSKPCQNDGICEANGDMYTCACMPHFTGYFCEELLSGASCQDSPCLHGGSCTPTDDGVSCECRPGFGGLFCERYLNVCAKEPCYNGGTCVEEGPDRFRCDCSLDWRGDLCQVYYHVTCETSPCLSNGTCRDTESGYECKCPPLRDPYTKYGSNCEVLTVCSSDPCLHGGACIYLGGTNYSCSCLPGYAGDHCETIVTTTAAVTTPRLPDKDYCLNVNCRNGGICKNIIGGFECDCYPDYTGVYCDDKRKTELRIYHVVVTLLKEFSTSLRYDSFKKEFSKEIHLLYHEITKESTISVAINSIKPGSTVVDFDLRHTVYQDASYAGHEAMRQVLQDALLKGELGSFPASLDNFVFEYIGGGENGGFPLWAGILIGFVLLAVLVIGVAVLLIIRYYQNRRPLSKLNNIPQRLQNEITNPAYVPGSDVSDIPNLRISGGAEENIYDELGPYAVTTKWDLQNQKNLDMESNIGGCYPSKYGREINKDWDSGYPYKPCSEASEYLNPRVATDRELPDLPPRLAPPPPYHPQDEGANFTMIKTPSDAYLTPVSHGKEEPAVPETSEEEFEDVDESGMDIVVPSNAYEMNKYAGAKKNSVKDLKDAESTTKPSEETSLVDKKITEDKNDNIEKGKSSCDQSEGQINEAYQSSDDSFTSQKEKSENCQGKTGCAEARNDSENEPPKCEDLESTAIEMKCLSKDDGCVDDVGAPDCEKEGEAVEVEYAIRPGLGENTAELEPSNTIVEGAAGNTGETKGEKENEAEEEEDYLALLPATDLEKKAASTNPATFPKARARHKLRATASNTGLGEARPKSMPSLVSPESSSVPASSKDRHIGPQKAASMASIPKPSRWWSRPSLGATGSTADINKPSPWWSRPSLGFTRGVKSESNIVPDRDPRRRKLPSLPKLGGRR